ncbi:MAG: hypothetical protein M1840_005535 [Geoglossum simile]|nr:MAG: hypothetical protein M1840_005535 [Geoglossum simile]
MPDIHAAIDYLQDLPLYQTEKPFWCFLPPDHPAPGPDTQRTDNLEFEPHHNLKITDIRTKAAEISLEAYGFEVLSHTSALSEIASLADVDRYKAETRELLRARLGPASFVKCYDLKLRKNVPFPRREVDMNDPLHVEGPARGAHVGMRLTRHITPGLGSSANIFPRGNRRPI